LGGTKFAGSASYNYIAISWIEAEIPIGTIPVASVPIGRPTIPVTTGCYVFERTDTYLIVHFLIRRYDTKKKFFCQVLGGTSVKCLGKSKGRIYTTMDDKSYKFLQVNILGKYLYFILEKLRPHQFGLSIWYFFF